MIADALTTLYALSVLGDGGAEANPVVAWGIENLGLVPAMMVRALIGIGMVTLVTFRYMTGYAPRWMSKGIDVSRSGIRIVDTPRWKVRRAALWSAVFMLTITAVVVGNNLHVIKMYHSGLV